MMRPRAPTPPDNGSPRDRILAPLLERLAGTCPAHGAASLAGDPLPHVVPNAALRAWLLADPALAALLPALQGSILLDDRLPVPFRVEPGPAIRLSPAVMGRQHLLATIVRWAIEIAAAAALAEAGDAATARAALVAALRHGRALAAGLGEEDRRALVAGLPEGLARLLAHGDGLAGALAGLKPLVMAPWLERLLAEGDAALWQVAEVQVAGLAELSQPLEVILVAGGDARLAVDVKTGLNRYGTTLRPRPEAIHFSSSTASSISDHGFRLADALRRRLLARGLAGEAPESLHEGLAEALRGCIAELVGLDAVAADVALAASGTDTELQAVLVALAGGEAPLTNILIAPEETGRGVVLAGAGRWFDDGTAAGMPVEKGAPIWPERSIETRAVAVRDPEGRLRPAAAILGELQAQVEMALAAGRRVLLHVVIGSKTGISAPPLRAVEKLQARAPGQIDVVVDACQMRAAPTLLGNLVRRGWMVQISGSKFLTGPPFSGALLLPAALRGRAAAAAALLARAPALGGPADWPPAWRPAGKLMAAASYGPLLRWAAALGEAWLLHVLDPIACRAWFERFATALRARLEASEALLPLPSPDAHLEEPGTEPEGLGARTIVCFVPTVPEPGGGRRPASLAECQLLFELLNTDVSARLSGLGPMERLLAARPAHIGQPVALRPDRAEAPKVLRLVIGARFFTIVGLPDDGDCEAALAGEIQDAITALNKLELLVRHLSELGPT